MTTASPPDPQRTRFLLINLILLVIVILCLSAAILIYRRGQTPAQALAPSPSATLRPSLTPSPTFTPSPTPSITLTPLPTNSPTPSLTPTWTPPPSHTPTPTGLPTLVPFRPAANASVYSLRDWTPDDASHMIALIQGYPDTLPASARGEDQSAYFAAFEYAVTAARESLLWFPDADEAMTWRWSLAYNLALTGDNAAGQEYADLIAAGLNSGETDLDLLYFWFGQHEPRQSLHMVEIDPPSGYLAAYIVELNDRQGGGAFIWLLHSSSGYRAYPILSAYDFVQPRHAAWIISELNNDPADGDELALYFTPLPGQLHLEPPLVYNLARIPARLLPSLPELNTFDVGMEYNNYWAVRPNDLGGNDLLFRSEIFSPCPIAVRRAYRWNGAYFEFVEASYTLENPPLELGYCDFIAAHAAAHWGPDAAAAIMETLLPDWPPPQDAQGKPYPADALDEWRYRLGVNYALLGEFQAARRTFQTIVDQPATRNSGWIQPAQDFLEVYQEPEDIYRACVGAQFCEPYFAIQYLIANLPGGQDPLTYLQSAGLSTFATGYFDFDDDQVRERWFTLRHRPLQALEFWILALHPAGVRALYAADVDTQTPSLVYLDPAYIHPDALDLEPVVFLDSRVAFSMPRAPESLLPYLVDVPLRKLYPDRFKEGVSAAKAALFSGASPKQVRGDLLSLAVYPGLLCKGDWSCDEYYYMLGLSSQLAGDEPAAVEAYHRLWSDYLRSPYTSMARLKLFGGAATPTPTATLTFTPTPTASVTVTLSGTLTPSLTPTSTVTGTPPTPTPTLSPTATTPGTTPQPSNTPTPTATTAVYPVPGTNTVAPTTYP